MPATAITQTIKRLFLIVIRSRALVVSGILPACTLLLVEIFYRHREPALVLQLPAAEELQQFHVGLLDLLRRCAGS
jgi:hypothetical protein